MGKSYELDRRNIKNIPIRELPADIKDQIVDDAKLYMYETELLKSNSDEMDAFLGELMNAKVSDINNYL